MEEIVYRLASDSDTDKVNRFYNSIYKTNRTKTKFEWEFNSSPAGKAIYVVAVLNNEIIGTQCIIPYYIISKENEVVLSGKSEDTLVSPNHRGKNIFEKMYSFLIEECRKRNILFIWGFTYAIKPFFKFGFQIPYKSKMGIFVIKPHESFRYFNSLSNKNTRVDRFKISLLMFISWSKRFISSIGSVSSSKLDFSFVELNDNKFNYLQYNNSFGLKLDSDFINYRITNNPYNNNYNTVNYFKNDNLLVSLTYNINNQKVGYVIHLYVADKTSKKEFKQFLNKAIKTTDLKTCCALRFWGFSHNLQNQKEIYFLNSAGFTFIKRGISFVWLSLNQKLNFKPESFVLSRMASQGTD